MEQFKKSLFEVYMNYDTLQFLKEENENPEDIIDMFKDELDYSQDLTKTLLKYDKSFLKSIAMRIKLKMKRQTSNSTIKSELLSYDQSLSPLLEKLIKSDSFVKQYNEIETNNIEVKNEVVKNKEEYVEEEEEDNSVADAYSDNEENENSNIDIFIENCVKVTEKSSDIIKVSDLYKQYCSYCDDNEMEKDSKSDFKKWLASSWGKSSKGGYQGYKLK